MKKIQGETKSVSQVLNGKFFIDFYQREYRWKTEHVVELLKDLTEKFLEYHEPRDERIAVRDYGPYFLGSIIISDKDEGRFITDGQQRLTSLTLILIHLHAHTPDHGQKQPLADLVRSYEYGQDSFNIEVEERVDCMKALFYGEPFDEAGQPESVVNLVARFRDIEETFSFPEPLRHQRTLPYFADWLMKNVYLVEITAYSDTDAYVIFKTMNDRGMSLTPTEMLKGYLLDSIKDSGLRDDAGRVWSERMEALRKLDREEEAAEAIKAWLRSQHAMNIRERKRDAVPKDFDLIGTEFHRWVEKRKEELSLTDSASFADFILRDFDFYSRWYERIRGAAETLDDELPAIHFNARNNFTLQYPVLLAPLRRDDGEDRVRRKLRVVSTFIDILIARRIWNFKATSYSTMQYAMFLLIREIRGKSVEELADVLHGRLVDDNEKFDAKDPFRLHGTNGPQIHRLLARMTDFIETSSGQSSRSRYPEYVRRSGKNGYEVEHIWANHPERHIDEFPAAGDFEEYRDRIGGLLLLPKKFNASFGDMTYEEKLEHYYGQNLLAKSLCKKAYENNPGFNSFIKESGLPFGSHERFRRADLDARQELYRKIAEKVWDPGILLQQARPQS